MNRHISYDIQKKEQLSLQEEAALQALVQACCLHDSCSLSCSFEPGTSYYLLYLKEESSCRFISAACVLPYDDTLAECTAFTHPDWRRQGYFSALLDCILEDFCETDLLFPLSNAAQDGLAVLTHLGAEFQASEFQMELSLKDAVILKPMQTAPGLSLLPGEPDKNKKATSDEAPDQGHLSAPDETSTPDGTLLKLVRNDGLLLGSCRLSPAGSGCLCLHHVEILEPYRKQGFGSALMFLLLKQLTKKNISRLILQVSWDNAPALALYKKTGFRITETLSYYLY